MSFRDLTLLHYSHKEVRAVRSVPQGSDNFFKPSGFWLSVEGNNEGWADWCKAEGFDKDWSHIYEVRLLESANILWLQDVIDIDVFTEKYNTGQSWPMNGKIDWCRVAEQHDGFLVAPYQWGRRLTGLASKWYYSWDCASGCIWEESAIEELNPVVSEAA